MPDAHSFTPVQPRKLHPLTAQRHPTDHKIWTTAQCQRLLRPITSRIELLKKDPGRLGAVDSRTTKVPQPRTVRENKSSQAEKYCSDTEDKDPEWASRRKRIRMKRTYGRPRSAGEAISRNKATPSLVPGEISVSTPILGYINSAPESYVNSYTSKAEDIPKIQSQRHAQIRQTRKDGGARFQLAEDMRRIKKTTQPSCFALYEGLYNALETLLKVTMPHTVEELPPSRSLLSTCLRSVPKYISVEETWIASESKKLRQKSMINQRDVSTEVYADLESLGTSERGWKHLKTVVRAHGVHRITEVVAERLVDTEFASALVMLCVRTACPDEAEILLSSLLDKQYPEPSSIQTRMSEEPEMLAITTLMAFAKLTGNKAYQYRKICYLVITGALPKTWLATRDFCPVWTSLFTSLSTDSPSNKDACAFFDKVIPILSKEDTIKDNLSSALETTLASAIRILVSMCLVNQTSKAHRDSAQSSKLQDLLRCILIECGIFSSPFGGIRSSLIVLSNLILPGFDNLDLYEPSETLLPLVQIIHKSSQYFESTTHFEEFLSEFICSIARCCGRCSTDSGFEHLQILLNRLQSLIAIDVFDAGQILRRIAVESAVTYSHQLPDQKHVHYAEQMETKLLGPPTRPREPVNCTIYQNMPGFRWEEGISEWVTATPAVSSRKVKKSTYFSSGDESDYDRPLRIRLKRSLQQTMTCQGKSTGAKKHLPCKLMSDLVPPSPDALADGVYEAHTTGINASILDQSERSNKSRFQDNIGKTGTRRPVSKRRRFGDLLLSSQQNWKLFEIESDDELSSSFLSQTDSTSKVLISIPNSKCSGRGQTTVSSKCTFNLSQKSGRVLITGTDDTDDSEDELGLI